MRSLVDKLKVDEAEAQDWGSGLHDAESGGASKLLQPLVTVNILAYNRRHELRITLEKITRELNYPQACLEIIVVDNASQDGTPEMVASEFPAVRVISTSKNEGIGGWNRGFEAGAGEFFLVLDDDCFIDGNALSEALQAARQYCADLVSFEVTIPDSTGTFVKPAYSPGLLGFWGCAVLISRRAIQHLDGFDQKFFVWAHEVEFTMRLLDAGFTHLFFPNVVSRHLKKPGQGGAVAAPTFGAQPKAPRLNVFFEGTNRRHFGYIAGKLMCLPHALPTLVNLILDSLMFFYHYRSWDVFSLVRSTIAGFIRGLRYREPVRWSVSRLYRKNFADFANPLMMLGKRPRRTVFARERPQYYPTSAAALKL